MNSSSVLQINRTCTLVGKDAPERRALRRHFDAHHWIRLPGLLERALLDQVRRGVAAAAFVAVRHEAVTPPSVDVCMQPNAISGMLELVCNDAAMCRALEALTGCRPLVRFNGFVYRLAPGAGQHHWHNDVAHDRRLAMSINLEPEPCTGGLLQIRERQSGRVLEEVANTGFGDAIVFRIDPALQHRATVVTSGVKTAFAGWFRSAEPLGQALRRSLQ